MQLKRASLALAAHQSDQFVVDLVGYLDQSGTLAHDVGLLDPAPCGDVVPHCCPLPLLDHQVLPPFVEDSRKLARLLQPLDLFNYLLGAEFELVAQVLQQHEFLAPQQPDQFSVEGFYLVPFLLLSEFLAA